MHQSSPNEKEIYSRQKSRENFIGKKKIRKIIFEREKKSGKYFKKSGYATPHNTISHHPQKKH
jgi:hypothetical protein